ncbi:uncharacterized protein LOC131846135 [Achroia grisella]|uniref:uncharacterized protein LOC131846135 n=1 Tax=Achroia grisella TaxID=688607 RepID=UPI0027D1F85B|nr:uncharacterized protein LOC131846135 [Achroia grisella]
MIVLLIALCLPAVGKTDSWNPVVSYIVLRRNSQLSDFGAAPRHMPSELLPLSPLQPFENSAPIHNYRPEYRVESDPPDNPIYLTVREHQSKLYISRVVEEKMNRPFFTNSNNKPNNKEQTSRSMNDQIHFPIDEPPKPDRTLDVSTPNEDVAAYLTERESEVTTLRPVEAITNSGPNTTEISVDDRASFDGDPCPAGFVKVNGKCVEKD